MKPTAKQPGEWDLRFFQLCDLIGAWGDDPTYKVGAVIVGPANELLSSGFNGLPRGVKPSTADRHLRAGGEADDWFEHAERDAIYSAARNGVRVSGCAIYSNLFPCLACTRAIIQSGIVALNSYAPPEDDDALTESYRISLGMLADTNVNVTVFARNSDS